MERGLSGPPKSKAGGQQVYDNECVNLNAKNCIVSEQIFKQIMPIIRLLSMSAASID
jgi:hypothetical protein